MVKREIRSTKVNPAPHVLSNTASARKTAVQIPQYQSVRSNTAMIDGIPVMMPTMKVHILPRRESPACRSSLNSCGAAAVKNFWKLSEAPVNASEDDDHACRLSI